MKVQLNEATSLRHLAAGGLLGHYQCDQPQGNKVETSLLQPRERSAHSFTSSKIECGERKARSHGESTVHTHVSKAKTGHGRSRKPQRVLSALCYWLLLLALTYLSDSWV